MVEARAAGGQTINVRRLYDRITVAAQLGAQVVRDYEEDVVLRSLRRGEGGCMFSSSNLCLLEVEFL
jgi:hypothetical protein